MQNLQKKFKALLFYVIDLVQNLQVTSTEIISIKKLVQMVSLCDRLKVLNTNEVITGWS